VSGGVARLETNHANVMAVGAAIGDPAAMFSTTPTALVQISGLDNVNGVNRATYSNFGLRLTLMAPTDSPATLSNGRVLGLTRIWGIPQMAAQ
jgi:hypothetical protein